MTITTAKSSCEIKRGFVFCTKHSKLRFCTSKSTIMCKIAWLNWLKRFMFFVCHSFIWAFIVFNSHIHRVFDMSQHYWNRATREWQISVRWWSVIFHIHLIRWIGSKTNQASTFKTIFLSIGREQKGRDTENYWLTNYNFFCYMNKKQ